MTRGVDAVADEPEYQCDLLVVGGGMAGLTAASVAARAGASVIVVEKGGETGGTARGSGGYVWTLPSLAVAHEQAFDGNPDLQQVIYEEFPGLVEWMRELGVEVRGPLDVMTGRGYHVDIGGYLDRATRVITANDGILLLNSTVSELLSAPGGAVVGAVIVDSDGDAVRVGAPWTILATGGFTADPELTDEFLGSRVTPMRVRASRRNSGDGLKLARQAGAASAPSRAFYGHLVATGIPLDDLLTMRTYGLYHSDHCLLLGSAGNRFVDESQGDHLSVQSDYWVKNGSAVLLWDERINREVVLKPWIPGSPGEDRFKIATDAGARTVKAEALNDLAAALSEWGFDGSVAVETVSGFNSGVESGAPLAPERREHREPILEAPFYAVEVSPAITFPYGGLSVNAKAQVLATSGECIDGLLAAGSDVGGIMGPDYTGGLCTSGAFALRAAATATS